MEGATGATYISFGWTWARSSSTKQQRLDIRYLLPRESSIGYLRLVLYLYAIRIK